MIIYWNLQYANLMFGEGVIGLQDYKSDVWKAWKIPNKWLDKQNFHRIVLPGFSSNLSYES